LSWWRGRGQLFIFLANFIEFFGKLEGNIFDRGREAKAKEGRGQGPGWLSDKINNLSGFLKIIYGFC
jgi:hypothetical protein